MELDEGLEGYDAVVLVTAHPGIDYSAVLNRSALLVDLRGITRKLGQHRHADELTPVTA